MAKTSSDKIPDMMFVRPKVIPEEVIEAARRWVEIHNSHLFLLICYNRPEQVNLHRSFVDYVYRHREQFKDIKTLDILLDHFGGSVEAAYQLITLFRNHCKKLRIFIPDYAKSAATLLALGADEIWMGEVAEMGPLDAQIPDPREPDEYISALDEFRAVDYLRTHGFEILNEFVRVLNRTTSLRMKDKIQIASEHTTRLMQGLYQNVDPLHFGGSHRAVEMSVEYGKRVMRRHRYQDWSTGCIDTLLRKLAWDYPSHSFVIDIEEAKELGLDVNLLTGETDDLAHTILVGLEEAAGFIAVPKPTMSLNVITSEAAEDDD